MQFTVKGKKYETELSKSDIKQLIVEKYNLKDSSSVTNEMMKDYLANHLDEIETMDLSPDTDASSSDLSKKAQKGKKNAKKILEKPRNEDGSVTVKVKRHGEWKEVRFSKERLATMEELYNNGNGSEQDYKDIQTLIRNMYDYGDFYDVLEWTDSGLIKRYASNLEDKLGTPRFVVEGSSGIDDGNTTINYHYGQDSDVVISFTRDAQGRVIPTTTSQHINLRTGGKMTTSDGKTELIMHKQMSYDPYTGRPFAFTFTIKENGKDTHKYLKVQDEGGYHIKYSPGESV